MHIPPHKYKNIAGIYNMITDTKLLEAFLQNTARDTGLSVEFNQTNDGAQFNIVHTNTTADKKQYSKFDSKLVAIANNAVHFEDSRSFTNFEASDFNPNQYLNFNITPIEKINNKIRMRMAPQMQEQVFIDILEKPKEPEV